MFSPSLEGLLQFPSAVGFDSHFGWVFAAYCWAGVSWLCHHGHFLQTQLSLQLSYLTAYLRENQTDKIINDLILWYQGEGACVSLSSNRPTHFRRAITVLKRDLGIKVKDLSAENVFSHPGPFHLFNSALFSTLLPCRARFLSIYAPSTYQGKTHHRAVSIWQKLPKLREQILLVLKEACHLRVHLLLCQSWCVVTSCLLGIPLLFLSQKGEV